MRATLPFALALCVGCGGSASSPITDPRPDGTKHPEWFTGVQWSGNVNQSFSCNGGPLSSRASAVTYAFSTSRDRSHDLEWTNADGCVFLLDLNLSIPGGQAVATMANAPVSCVGHAADGSPVQEEGDAFRVATSDGKSISFHASARSTSEGVSCVFTDDGVLTPAQVPAGTKHPELFVGTSWTGTVAINAACNGVTLQGSSSYGMTIRASSVPGHDLEYTDGVGCLFRWNLAPVPDGQGESATLGNAPVTCVERISANDTVNWNHTGLTLRAADATHLTVHQTLTTVETTPAQTTTCVTTYDGTLTR